MNSLSRLSWSLRHLILLALLAWLAVTASAEPLPPETATLVADKVQLTGDNLLSASGNVEVLYKGRRLMAREVVYDRNTDLLTITGPLTITDGSATVLLADSAELDRDLQNGILRGARMVLEDQLQLAALEMNRVDGRYNQLYKVSATSCQVCRTGRPPLWQIRAERMIHDETAQQLYFHNAQLRVLDTPVLYLPRLRLPDPTLKRATGFLAPSMQNSSLLGTGIRVPYFFRLGDHRDLTIAPFFATNSRRIELRYRQAFRRGEIEFNGAVSDDDFSPKSTRGFFFGEGRFDLARDYVLRFNAELTSDDTFLIDHNFSDKDRLQSEISLERARRDEYSRVALTHYESLRVGESNSTLPSIVANGEYERRFFPRAIPGELRFSAAAHSHYRTSDLTTDGLDFDRFADGRDVTRLTGGIEWFHNAVLPAGVLASLQAGVALDVFDIAQAGTTSNSQDAGLTPSASVHLRWPLLNTRPGKAIHVVEPMLMLSWAGGSDLDVPNDENTHIEFDEGNLFNPSRFVSPDRRERGYSAAYGLNWTRYDPSGWQGALALGRVVRDEQLIEKDDLTPMFTKSSGLSNRTSDFLIAGQFRNNQGLTITSRGLFDEGFTATKAEARASWKNDRTDIGATYIWLGEDAAENRPDKTSEWSADGSYRFARHWTGSANWRYDAASSNSVRAGAGLTYTNECVDITLSVSRRFTSSTILEPETNIGFTVELRGFSASTGDKSYNRTCRN